MTSTELRRPILPAGSTGRLRDFSAIKSTFEESSKRAKHGLEEPAKKSPVRSSAHDEPHKKPAVRASGDDTTKMVGHSEHRGHLLYFPQGNMHNSRLKKST